MLAHLRCNVCVCVYVCGPPAAWSFSAVLKENVCRGQAPRSSLCCSTDAVKLLHCANDELIQENINRLSK